MLSSSVARPPDRARRRHPRSGASTASRRRSPTHRRRPCRRGGPRAHFGRQPWRVGHEIQHQAGDGDIELAVLERQRLRVADAEFGPRVRARARTRGSPRTGRRPQRRSAGADARIVWLSAPVPQPTSSQRLPAGMFSHARNSGATSRLQRPHKAHSGRRRPSWRVAARVRSWVPPLIPVLRFFSSRGVRRWRGSMNACAARAARLYPRGGTRPRF